MSDAFLQRLLVLISDDDELHEALVDLIKARTRSEIALADWRDRKRRVLRAKP